jgi:hypothetical protein
MLHQSWLNTQNLENKKTIIGGTELANTIAIKLSIPKNSPRNKNELLIKNPIPDTNIN